MEAKLLPLVFLVNAWCGEASEDSAFGEPTYVARRAPKSTKVVTHKNRRNLNITRNLGALVPVSQKTFSWLKEAEMPLVLSIGTLACWFLFLQRPETSNSSAAAHPYKLYPKRDPEKMCALLKDRLFQFYIRELAKISPKISDCCRQRRAEDYWGNKNESEFILETETNSIYKLIEEFSKCMSGNNTMVEYKENKVAKKAFFYREKEKQMGFLGFHSFDVQSRKYKLKIYAPKNYEDFSEDIKQFFENGEFSEKLENLVKKEDEEYKMPNIRIKGGTKIDLRNGGFEDCSYQKTFKKYKNSIFQKCPDPPYEIIDPNLPQGCWLEERFLEKDFYLESKYCFTYGCSAFVIRKYRDATKAPSISIALPTRYLERLAYVNRMDLHKVAKEYAGANTLLEWDDEFDVAHQSFRMYLKAALKARDKGKKSVVRSEQFFQAASSNSSADTQATESERHKPAPETKVYPDAKEFTPNPKAQNLLLLPAMHQASKQQFQPQYQQQHFQSRYQQQHFRPRYPQQHFRPRYQQQQFHAWREDFSQAQLPPQHLSQTPSTSFQNPYE
eukprot:GHVP01057019.1.p1 GENE.GHVP01057019.1~~GHVP01057019.1.p1  ORF type:complete len:557 (-),score=88.31 GHVP01057019.1:74-1744(-)